MQVVIHGAECYRLCLNSRSPGLDADCVGRRDSQDWQRRKINASCFKRVQINLTQETFRSLSLPVKVKGSIEEIGQKPADWGIGEVQLVKCD